MVSAAVEFPWKFEQVKWALNTVKPLLRAAALISFRDL